MSIAAELSRIRIKRTSMALSEEDYYFLQSKKPSAPVPGYLLLTRVPRSNFFTVMWPDGQSLKLMSAPNDISRLGTFGINNERADKALMHLWNFGAVYVKKTDGYPESPPSKIPKSL